MVVSLPKTVTGSGAKSPFPVGAALAVATGRGEAALLGAGPQVGKQQANPTPPSPSGTRIPGALGLEQTAALGAAVLKLNV